MNPKYHDIDGDALLMQDVRAVWIEEETKGHLWWKTTNYRVEVEYTDGESWGWDHDTRQAAEAMRDAIKARLA